jgi:MFS family permease
LWGVAAIGAVLPLLSQSWSFLSAAGLYTIAALAISTMITPSLTYMAEATASAGSPSFGVAYGLYNVAWAIGLLLGPALGGYLYERLGFTPTGRRDRLPHGLGLAILEMERSL